MRADIASIARTVTPIAKKYGVERVSLFGSRARGDAREESDYDFLIADGEIKSLFTFAAFLTDLEDAFHSPVDLITVSISDREFLAEIQQEAVLLYEREEKTVPPVGPLQFDYTTWQWKHFDAKTPEEINWEAAAFEKAHPFTGKAVRI